jgi:hypothetical protein
LDSNETDERNLQWEKQFEQRISQFRGITIDFSEESENASVSTRVNREFASNEIAEME